ncbi:MAG: hypothetical protein JO319_15300 [Acidobacteriaceae bacterium]|nr:hypothetical protein [Acidobacteriaceae bacterium]
MGRASARVQGELRGSQYLTVATSTIEKLNILDVITADLIVARVTSIYPVGGYQEAAKPDANHPSQFYLTGSYFANLNIEGIPKLLNIDPVVVTNPFQVPQTATQRTFAFRDASTPNTPMPDPFMTISQFGTIYAGEIDIFGSRVTLTMLRLCLGSPDSGNVAVATCCTNGHEGP